MIELSQMLEEYRAGERGLPSYDELMTLLNAPAGPLAIFQSAEQNEQLARDAQAIVDAEVAAMATCIGAWTPGRCAAPAAQGDAKDEVYEFAAKVIELFDDATMRANHMLDAGECASIIRALKSTEIAAIAAKAAS